MQQGFSKDNYGLMERINPSGPFFDPGCSVSSVFSGLENLTKYFFFRFVAINLLLKIWILSDQILQELQKHEEELEDLLIERPLILPETIGLLSKRTDGHGSLWGPKVLDEIDRLLQFRALGQHCRWQDRKCFHSVAGMVHNLFRR